MAKKTSAPTHVTSLRHQDSRVNIPTEELRDFVRDDEASPKTVSYPRDPSLDPQLVWKGKEEQDSADLTVPVVPIYIQEKIHPQVLIDEIPRKAKKNADQFTLFADFNGLPQEFDQRVDFYNHHGHWQNRMILGDSLLVMNSLAEKEGLKGTVQCIYLDPPYGIKFGSNWQVSTRKRDVKDGKAEDVTRQPEQVRAFRDTWELGIHSYLAYLRDRLVVARELLTESGSVFVQIGDENVHLVRCLLDEVFGAENFVAQVSFQKTGGIESKYLSSTVDYVLWSGKNKAVLKYKPLYLERKIGDTSLDRYDMLLSADNVTRRLTKDEMNTGVLPPGARRYQLAPLYSDGASTESQQFYFQGKKYIPRGDTHWKTTLSGLERLAVANRIEVMGTVIRYRRFAEDFPVIPIADRWDSMQIGVQRTYVVQTAASVIQRCLLMTTDPGDLVLDPTCGSGTTAYVAEQWGRRWITCDTSRVALALARTRLMSASFPYYLLADSAEGRKKAAELENRPPALEDVRNDIRKGFVFKRVPHITLKSIANNPDIKDGMTRSQIDAAIMRHAETEMLFDQPYEDRKAVRVAGPFTVESLSPHRVLAVADANMDGTVTEREAQKQQDFAAMILGNLHKAGVQNTRKEERLKFDRMEHFAGQYIQAVGHYTDKDGKSRRAAISIGPEHGTVGSSLVKEAAKEAVLGVGFDLLIVCGFAFDPSVSEEVKRYGNLTVLPARMNPDLAMGDALLKKTGAGNLFMVFGEPDLCVHQQNDGTVVVEIKGLDIYDPTTGEVRSNTTKDIACWFIDTNYNGESFFVRHAYFTGEGEPYARLKRALKADVDESVWASLYSTTSRAFPKPETGKIAVKVINHYGDEVMQVFGV